MQFGPMRSVLTETCREKNEKLYVIHTYPGAQQKGFGLGGNLQAGGV